MAKKIEIDILVNGNLQKVAVDAKTLSAALESTGEHAQTTDRRLKGAAQASSNGTKNFAKMAQGITGGLVPAYATLAANVFAIGAAFNFLKGAAQVSILESAQVSYAQNTGVAMDRLTDSLRKASQGMLNFQEAAQASAIGAAKGFSAEQMNKMAEGALKVSNVLGRDFTDAFDRLVRGVSKAEPELLDELGITLRLEKAKKDYALQLGKTADSLTTAEQSQAVYMATMKQLTKQTEGTSAKANPFTQLAATFSDVVKNVVSFFLPALESLANFLNDNAAAALAFFGALGVGIVKSMPFVDDLKTKFGEWADSQSEKLQQAKDDWDSYNKKIEQTKQSVASIRAQGAEDVASGAKQAIAAGSKSPVLQRAAEGAMLGPDKSNLKKALASAEKQYASHQKIVSGIFKGMSIDMVRQIAGGLDKVEVKATTTFGKITGFVERQRLRVQKLGTSLRVGLASAAITAGKAFNFLEKQMSRAMKATVILGIVQMLYDMIMAVVNAPATVIDRIVSIAKSGISIFQWVVNVIIDGINYVIEQLNRIPGVSIGTIEQATLGTELNKSIDNYIKNSKIVQGLRTWEQERTDAENYKATLDEIISDIPNVARAMNKIAEGDSFTAKLDENGVLQLPDLEKRARAAANAISSLGISGLMEKAMTLPEDQQKEALTKIAEGLGIRAQLFSKEFANAVIRGDAKTVEELTASAGSFTANINSFEDGIANMTDALQGKTTVGIRIFLDDLQRTGEAAVEQGAKLGLTTNILDQLDERFKGYGGREAFLEGLRQIEEAQDRLTASSYELQRSQIATTNAPGAVGRQLGLQYGVQQQELALDAKKLELKRQISLAATVVGEEEQLAHNKRIAQISEEIFQDTNKLNISKQNVTELGQLGLAVGNSLADTMQSAFDGLIQGTMTAKEAFASMAKGMLQSIAKVISELLVAKILTAALGGTSFGGFLGIPAKRYGGVVSNGKDMPGYAAGGIAKGSNAGYPVMMHGTEAVVPLPNGKSIPVDLKGAGQQNNVTVNVSMSGEGTRTTSDSNGKQGADLGSIIASAVQKELQNQKRSGGILNPYGAS